MYVHLLGQGLLLSKVMALCCQCVLHMFVLEIRLEPELYAGVCSVMLAVCCAACPNDDSSAGTCSAGANLTSRLLLMTAFFEGHGFDAAVPHLKVCS